MLIDGVNKPIGVLDASRPEARQIFFQGLWLTDSLKGRALYIVDQLVDALEGFLILTLPIDVVVPRFICPTQQSLTTHPLTLVRLFGQHDIALLSG